MKERMMNDKQRLLLALALGLDEDHEMRQHIPDDAFDGILDIAEIEKDDLLNGVETEDMEDNFFKYEAMWKHLPELVRQYQEKGTPISPEDIYEVERQNKLTLLDMAVDVDMTEMAFLPEIWKGRIDDMEYEWYTITKDKRQDIDFLPLKRKAAQLAGHVLREDVLAESGVEIDEIKSALSDGDFDSINHRLAMHGDHLRFTDFLFVDTDGDTPFYATNIFQDRKFEKLLTMMRQHHNEVPDLSFFLFNRGGRATVLQNVIKNDALDQVFTVDVWKGRAQEMMEVYSHVPQGKREKMPLTKIADVLHEIYSDDALEKLNDITVEDLTFPVDVIKFEMATGDVKDYPVILLGFDGIWGRIDDVRQSLEQKGEKLGAEHLAMKTGIPQRSAFMAAIESGYFEQALDILVSDTGLSADLLLDTNESGKTALEMIIDKGQVEKLFDKELWVGKAQDFVRVYQALPDNQKERMGASHSDVNLLTLRDAFSKSDSAQAVLQSQTAERSGFKPS